LAEQKDNINRSQYQNDELSIGDMVWVELGGPGKVLRRISRVRVPRVGFDHELADFLPKEARHLIQCKSYNDLCPACRAFGWVSNEKDPGDKHKRVAYRGRVQLEHALLKKSNGELDDTPLAILGSPKPTTEQFYLLNRNGEPDATVTYDDQNAQLRGRKFYLHHDPADPKEYTRPALNGSSQPDGQNRTIRGALQLGATFEFTLRFQNLAPLELGALLHTCLLEPDMYHRLGYAKPLGFGSVKLNLKNAQLINWQKRLESLMPDAGVTLLDGQAAADWAKELIKKFSETMQETYGDQYARVWEELGNLLGATNHGMPIHYPRSTDDPHPKGQQFRWFVQNDKDGKEGEGETLDLASEEQGGLRVKGDPPS
jgi:CRISPR-associated protein (TIGR03986 family)